MFIARLYHVENLKAFRSHISRIRKMNGCLVLIVSERNRLTENVKGMLLNWFKKLILSILDRYQQFNKSEWNILKLQYIHHSNWLLQHILLLLIFCWSLDLNLSWRSITSVPLHLHPILLPFLHYYEFNYRTSLTSLCMYPLSISLYLSLVFLCLVFFYCSKGRRRLQKANISSGLSVCFSPYFLTVQHGMLLRGPPPWKENPPVPGLSTRNGLWVYAEMWPELCLLCTAKDSLTGDTNNSPRCFPSLLFLLVAINCISSKTSMFFTLPNSTMSWPALIKFDSK